MVPEAAFMQQNRLDSLPPGLLAELAERGELRAFARNEQLISEGGSSDFLFILVAGEVKVFTQDEKGRELVYNVLQAGELFGELFLDGDVRSASVRAITDVRCILVDRALAQGSPIHDGGGGAGKAQINEPSAMEGFFVSGSCSALVSKVSP
jgi:CRP/FNR family cyclic AMP-dependent transcriptional regulator